MEQEAKQPTIPKDLLENRVWLKGILLQSDRWEHKPVTIEWAGDVGQVKKTIVYEERENEEFKLEAYYVQPFYFNAETREYKDITTHPEEYKDSWLLQTFTKSLFKANTLTELSKHVPAIIRELVTAGQLESDEYSLTPACFEHVKTRHAIDMSHRAQFAHEWMQAHREYREAIEQGDKFAIDLARSNFLNASDQKSVKWMTWG